MTDSSIKTGPIAFVALFLAWLIPGAGHAYLGRPLRGAIIFIVIGATFWGGIALGGVMTVDYESEKWWFAAEILTGAHGVAGWHRQRMVYQELAADAAVGPAPLLRTEARMQWNFRVDKKLAADGTALVYPTDTVARAYAGVAGLLNLMCMFDAVMLSLLAGRSKPAGKGKDHGEQQSKQ